MPETNQPEESPSYVGDATIKKLFGEFDYSDSTKNSGAIIIDSNWVKQNIITVSMPILGPVKCHKLIAKNLTRVFCNIEYDNNQYLIDIDDWKQEGGCYVPRHISWNPAKALSRHSWAIAIDLNVRMNPQGKLATDDRQFLLNEYMEREGFTWGNDFSTPDSMHWEYGYHVLQLPI
jgi:hypothetical protein